MAGSWQVNREIVVLPFADTLSVEGNSLDALSKSLLGIDLKKKYRGRKGEGHVGKWAERPLSEKRKKISRR